MDEAETRAILAAELADCGAPRTRRSSKPCSANQQPEFLDGARVVQFASLEQAQPTGETRHIVNGSEVSGFAAVAVAQYDEDSRGAYLFYCDESWNVVTDTWHEDVLSAVKQASFEFGLLPFAEVSGSE